MTSSPQPWPEQSWQQGYPPQPPQPGPRAVHPLEPARPERGRKRILHLVAAVLGVIATVLVVVALLTDYAVSTVELAGIEIETRVSLWGSSHGGSLPDGLLPDMGGGTPAEAKPGFVFTAIAVLSLVAAATSLLAIKRAPLTAVARAARLTTVAASTAMLAALTVHLISAIAMFDARGGDILGAMPFGMKMDAAAGLWFLVAGGIAAFLAAAASLLTAFERDLGHAQTPR